MKKLSKRTLASRANGKLARGPVTTAGLLRASANSTRHGILSDNLVLDDESKAVFAILHQQFIDRLNPADGIEICLVEDLASTVWRQRRLLGIETHLFREASAKRPEETHLGRLGGGFSDLCRMPEIHLLDRYESRLHRMFQRTLKNLQLLRQIEHTDPSTGELTQFPAAFTKTPSTAEPTAPATDAEVTPGNPAIHELPNEPKSLQPVAALATYPQTSIVDSQPDTAEDVSAKSGSDLSPLSTEEEVPPAQPATEINELPNEPKSPQPTDKSATSPVTSQPKPAPVDPYQHCQRFEYDPAFDSIKRIA